MANETMRAGSPWSWVLLPAMLLYGWQGRAGLVTQRLWAEEAALYLQQAELTDSPWQTLLSPALGYYSLISRALAALLVQVPLAWMGAVNQLFVLLAMLGLFVAVGRFRPGLRQAWVFSCCAVLLANGEMLSNSLLLSYWYGAGAAVMMLLPPSGPDAMRRGWPDQLLIGAVLLLGALSGPHALFILPVAAVFHRWQGRMGSWLRDPMVRLYALCGLIQVLFIAWSLLDGSYQTGAAQGGQRFSGLSAAGIGGAFIKYNLAYPVFGYALTGLAMPVQAVALALAAVAWCVVLVFGGREVRQWLVAALVLQTLYLVASIGVAGGVRYAFAANTVLLLGLFTVCVLPSGPRVARWAAMGLLGVAVFCSQVDGAQRLAKFAQPAWPNHGQSLSQACLVLRSAEAVNPAAVPVCLQAWPADERSWSYCPRPNRLAKACAALP